MKKISLGVLVLFSALALNACGDAKNSGSGGTCPQSAVDDYNKLKTEANNLDAERQSSMSPESLERYKRDASQLKADAKAFQTNYAANDNCTATIDGEKVEMHPAKVGDVADLIDQQLAAINQAQTNGTQPQLGDLGTVAPGGTFTNPTPVSDATCGSMNSDERKMTDEARSLANSIESDFQTSYATNRTTTAMRSELAAFNSKYQSLSCPDANMSCNEFNYQMGSTLSQIDDLLRQISSGGGYSSVGTDPYDGGGPGGGM